MMPENESQNMDIMKASFPGDTTAATSKRMLEQRDFADYAENYLWQDGIAPVARNPRLWASQEDVPARGTIIGKTLQRNEFDQLIEYYWKSSSFNYFEGTPAVLDLVCILGRERSRDDREMLAAFKEISTLALRTEKEQLLRFGDIRPESIQFFHSFDEEDSELLNFHSHNILLLT